MLLDCQQESQEITGLNSRKSGCYWTVNKKVKILVDYSQVCVTGQSRCYLTFSNEVRKLLYCAQGILDPNYPLGSLDVTVISSIKCRCYWTQGSLDVADLSTRKS